MISIHQFGTFDIENYGDLLYPIVFKRLLHSYDPNFSLRRYSFLEGKAPQNAGYETFAVRGLFEEGPTSRKIVIGGGDLLRTDSQLVAAHYEKAHFDPFNRLRRSLGTVGLLHYLARKCVPRLQGSRFFIERFRMLRMDYPAPGPFMISPESLANGSTVHYLSCGVPFEFTPTEADEIRHSIEGAEFIYLRDNQSVEKLKRAGVQQEIHVAPDLIVTISDQYEQIEEARKGREILSRFGVNAGQPFLCFQSTIFPGFAEKEIVRQLLRYRQRTDSEVVLLPLGYCHRDHEFLRRLSRLSAGILRLADLHSIFDSLSVIAASDIFVGTSLHGNITAFSFGIPMLFGPLPVDKAEGFLDIVNLPGDLKLRSWNEMNEKIDMINEFDPTFFSARAQKAKLKVYSVVNKLLESLSN